MLKRLLVPMLFALVLPVGLCLIWNTTVWVFVDLWAFLAVPGLGSLYAFALRGFRAAGRAFAAPLDSVVSLSELESSAAFFELLGKSYFGFGAVTSAISLIDMFRNLADRTQLGPRLAVVLIGLMYAGLLYLLVVLPFGTAARRRLEEVAAA